MAKFGCTVEIDDKGLTGFFGKMTDEDISCEVGVIESKDPETALIAKVHEHGLGTAPQRSFLRATMESNRRKYGELSKKGFEKVVDGDWSLTQLLNAVGAEIVGDVKKRIMKSIPPALQDKTVDSKQRRGLPRPRTALYATGKLFEAIRFRIVGGGK